MYLNSTNVKVFPSAYRGQKEGTENSYNPESRLNTEFNITGLINRLADRDSFILGDFEVDNGVGVLVCSIKGYWFELKMPIVDLDTLNNSNDIYAHINIENKNTNYDPTTDVDNIDYPAKSLSSFTTSYSLDDIIDSVSKFVGLSLDNTSTKGFKVLERTGTSTYAIPAGSHLKFKTDYIEDINGKSVAEQITTGKIKIGSGVNAKYISDIS